VGGVSLSSIAFTAAMFSHSAILPGTYRRKLVSDLLEEKRFIGGETHERFLWSPENHRYHPRIVAQSPPLLLAVSL